MSLLSFYPLVMVRKPEILRIGVILVYWVIFLYEGVTLYENNFFILFIWKHKLTSYCIPKKLPIFGYIFLIHIFFYREKWVCNVTPVNWRSRRPYKCKILTSLKTSNQFKITSISSVLTHTSAVISLLVRGRSHMYRALI